MRHKTLIGGTGYATSTAGALLLGAAAWLLMPSYPASAIVLMIAATVALTALALRWMRRQRRQRRLEKANEISTSS